MPDMPQHSKDEKTFLCKQYKTPNITWHVSADCRLSCTSVPCPVPCLEIMTPHHVRVGFYMLSCGPRDA